MIELILYTRNDCELCREMEEMIAAELPKFDARIQRIEIDGDPDLEARFGIEVPVLFVNDQPSYTANNPAPVADGGGYRLSKEAIILYGMANVAALGAKGIRINCTGPGVTDTPMVDQLRGAYGQEFLDAFQTPLGRVSEPSEQAAVLVFLNSKAASYITGQVVWVDGGTIGETDLAGSVARR